MASPVLPKPKKCPTLIAAAYVGLGPSRDQKGGFIYPDFYENFMGFIQLKSNYFKEYTVQGNGYFSSRMVQGCIHAVSTNRIILFYLLHGVQLLGEFYGVHNWLILVTPLILKIQHSFPRNLALDLSGFICFSGVSLFLRSTLILYYCNYGLDH